MLHAVFVTSVHAQGVVIRCSFQSGNAHAAIDDTGLESRLVVQRDVQSVGQEGHASRVAVYAVYGYHAVAGGIAQESDVLVGVGQQSSCLAGACRCRHDEGDKGCH